MPMFGNSSPVSSNQQGPHHHLASVVARHATTSFLKPILDFNRTAFETSLQAWRENGMRPLILDAGCGVGWSTANLAHRFPDHFVIGVDQSADRLSRESSEASRPDNAVCVRADLIDYWRLLHEANIRPARQYVLYPNPWPKSAHLGRRWHGHPVFPTLVALGGDFECRSNWRVYIEECAQALAQLGASEISIEHFESHAPITPFERKYAASGHELWRCTARLP